MADNNALAAALLGSQRRRTDPFESRRAHARAMLQQGSSTAPVQSWGEGLARALQGVAGGLFEGWTDRDQKDRDQKTISALSGLAGAKDQNEFNAHLGTLKDSGLDTEVLAPVLTQTIGQRLGSFKNASAADNFAGAYGQPTAPATMGTPPSPRAAGAPGAGPNPNNVGNITNGQGGFRQYETPQAGASDLVSLLRAYPVQYNQGQPMTLAQIGARYAPADDGKDPMLKGNDPNVWARNVGQIAGVDPNQPLDFDNPAVVTAVVRGINAQEKGANRAQPAPVLNQGVAAGMDPAAQPPLTINVTPSSFAPQGVGNPAGGPTGGFAPPDVAQNTRATGPQQGDQPRADGSGTPLPPPGVSGPPDVPRPAPSAEQIAKYKRMIADGVLSGPQAVQELDKEITGQWNLNRQQAMEVWKDQQQTRRQTEERDAKKPQETFQNESKLRGEFEGQPAVKSFRTVVPMLESAKQAGLTRAGDLNLVYAFAKLMDPDSVVRESETGAVVATQSVADRLQAYLGQLNGQPMLNPETRAKLIAELDSRFNALKSSHDTLAEQYGGIAKAHGLEPARVIIPIRGAQEGAPAGTQPGQAELQRWANGGQAGAERPVYDMNGQRVR